MCLETFTNYSGICLHCWLWEVVILKGFSTMVLLDESGCNLLEIKMLLKLNIHWPWCLGNIFQVLDGI